MIARVRGGGTAITPPLGRKKLVDLAWPGRECCAQGNFPGIVRTDNPKQLLFGSLYWRTVDGDGSR